MSKKHFWRRVLAAVLTLALSFSILAMPASAAGSNSWAYGVLTTNMDGSCYEWGTEQFLRDGIINYWNTSGQASVHGPMTDEMLDRAIPQAKTELASQGFITRDFSLPANAYLGYSNSLDSTIYWYSKSDISSLLVSGTSYYSVDWNTGVLTATNGYIETVCYPLSSSSSGSSSSGSGSSSGGSSSSGEGGALLLVGGAVVAAASIFYLHTHPEIVENAKQRVHDFFQGIVEKFQPEETPADASSDVPVQPAA